MEQLSLFDDLGPTGGGGAPDAEVPAEGAQLDLFGDRMLVLAGAREALAELDTAAARRLLRDALSRYGHDGGMVRAIEALDHLAFRVERALRSPAGERPEALVSVAGSIEPLRRGEVRCEPAGPFPSERLWRSLLRRAAALAVARGGDASSAGGFEPGWLLLLGGDLEGAEASIMRCVRATLRPRFVALLGECARRRGDAFLARQLYLSALRANPYDVDFAAIGDDAVSSLPAQARYRFEIEDEPVAWSAAVGVVTGVFELATLFGEGDVPEPKGAEGLSAAQRRALSQASLFLEALRSSRRRPSGGDSGLIEARRTMKRLQPVLFEVVMGRSDR